MNKFGIWNEIFHRRTSSPKMKNAPSGFILIHLHLYRVPTNRTTTFCICDFSMICVKITYIKIIEPQREKAGLRGFRQGKTNRPVQTWKQARSLKVRIYVNEDLYYLCSKNKGADQLCSYCKEISYAVTARLICAFVFAYSKSGFITTRLINTPERGLKLL